MGTSMGLVDLHSQTPTPVEPELSIEELIARPSFAAAVDLIEARYDFRRHPYFLWMDSPRTSIESFRASQVPFRFAVEAFSQALAAVVARTPRVEQRLGVLDNVDEEHGRGNLWASHKATFTQFLRALGAGAPELERGCPVQVRAFNQALLDFSLTQSYDAGAALLGIIEQLYIGISASIALTVRVRGWCAPGSQTHYEVHEALDVSHARDLFALAEPAWRESGSRAQVALGLGLGAHWFWALYRDLLPAG
jgi:pyrroloquinoline-quinone synthase